MNSSRSFLVLASSLFLLSNGVLSSEQGNTGGGVSRGGGAVPSNGVGRRAGVDVFPLSTLVPLDGLTELGSGIYRITDPRPMEGIAMLIQRKFGISVSYEEEVLQYSGDMVY